MDEQRFDAALKALHTGTTRRKGLAAAIGVLLGGTTLDAAARDEQARNPASEGPCGNGSARDNRCKRNGDCCTKWCADGECRCKPNWMTCTKNDHCCSDACLNGRCDGGAKPAGGRCEENFNCQDGLACIRGVCTRSNQAKCTKQNCPGCCEGTTCRVGSSRMACGAKGGACSRCAAGASCTDGTCGGGCSRATCPNGCCKSGVCKAGTSDQACGTKGGACAKCTSGNTCQAGICKAGGGGPSFTSTSVIGPAKSAVVSADGLTIWGIDAGSFKQWTRTSLTETTWTATELANDFNTFFNTSSLAVAPDGLTVLITSVSTDNVLVWGRDDTSSSWTARSSFGSSSQFRDPRGLSISGDGLTALIVGSNINGNINGDAVAMWTRVDTDPDTTWTYQSTFGSFGVGDDQFNGADGVSMRPDGLTALASDRNGRRIEVWTRSDAQPATIWSHQTNFGSIGSGPDQFEGPSDVAVTSDGLTAYIADKMNNRISVWTRPNATSTAWANEITFNSLADGSQLNSPQWVSTTPDGATLTVIDLDSTTSGTRLTVWKRN